MEVKFKVGDWVNIHFDAASGNKSPGRVDSVNDDGAPMVRWSNEFGLNDNAWPWDPDDLVLVDAPAIASAT